MIKISTNKTKLTIKSTEVNTIEEGEKIAQPIVEFLKSNPKVFGLSAPQIGIYKRVSVIHAKKENDPIVLINPKIERVSEHRVFYREVCPSLPGRLINTVRHLSVEVSALNLSNVLTFGYTRDITEDEIKTGKYLQDYDLLEAVTIQHEIDHLDGILMTNPIRRFDRIVKPQKEIKIGRNDKVILKNKITGETKREKYKFVESLLATNEWEVI